MRTGLILCAVFLLMMALQGSFSVDFSLGQGEILRVPQDFPTIQKAADAAPEGATILVAPGTYTEVFTVTKSVTLQGSGTEATILQPLPNPHTPDPRFLSIPESDQNPIITLQPPQGREITLLLKQLTLRSPPDSTKTSGFGIAVGIRLKDTKKAHLIIEQTHWTRLWSTFSGDPVLRLEIRDSTFDYNGYFAAQNFYLNVDEAAIERSHFIENALTAIGLQGKRIQITDNTIIGSPEHSFEGITVNLTEGGRGEVIRNSVSLEIIGVGILQSGREARAIVQNNQLFANSYNVLIEALSRTSSRFTPQLDISVEENIIIGGGLGVEINSEKTEGEVRLQKNHIVWQRSQSLTGSFAPPLIESGCLPFCTWERANKPIFGHGVVVLTTNPSSLPDKRVQPLKLKLSENRIEENEGLGLAFGTSSGMAGELFNCIELGKEGVIAPTITGSGNEFKNNAKGAICPNAYPLPPGFMK